MSGPGSGLGSSFGTGIEAAGSYGTLATISRWNATDNHKIRLNRDFHKGGGLRGGQDVRSSTDRALIQAMVAGTIQMPFRYVGMGQLVGSNMGSLTTTPAEIGTSGAYTQTHAWSSTMWQQSISIQEGIVDVAQTVHYWNTLGAKIEQAKYECGANTPLTCEFTVDAQDRFEAASGTSPTEPSGDYMFTFRDMVVKIGAYGSEAKVDGVRKWTGQVKRGLKKDRFNAGNVTTNPSESYAVKDEPAMNGWSDITGTLDTEYLDDTLFENYLQTDTYFSLIVAFTSTVTAGTSGTNKFSVTFAFPYCKFTDSDPEVDGPVIVAPSMNYEVWNDGTHPPATITIVSTDSTL